MNRRDKQIAAINANTEGLRQDRLLACRAQILEAYKESSVVDRLSSVTEVADREPSDFRVWSNSEARPEEHFNGDSYHWEYYCKQIGRSIALAEERHIFEELGKIAGHGDAIDAARPTFQSLFRGTEILQERGFRPSVLVAPIAFYMPVFKLLVIDWQDGRHVTLPGGHRLELFWSSKSIPIDRFVVLDPRAGEWKVKLDAETQERLTVAIGRPKSPPRAVTFLAETVVDYKIIHHDGLYVVEVVGEPPEEFGLTETDEQGRNDHG